MSQREPLVPGGENNFQPTAPTLSPSGSYGAPPGQAAVSDAAAAPPPAYTIPSSSQQYIQPQPQEYLEPNVIQQQQTQQTSNQPYYPQSQQSQFQPGQPGQVGQLQSGQPPAYQPQINNNVNYNPSAPNYNYYPQVDNAVAAPAPGYVQGQGQRVVMPNTQVIVSSVPANNGYAAMPGTVIVQPVAPDPRNRPAMRGQYPRRPPRPMVGDEPGCLYIFAVLSLFFPVLGLITICCLNCGSGLGPRRARAFRRLVIFTVIGLVINGIFFWNEDWWYDSENEGNENWHDN